MNNYNIELILVDMDGVLADFVGSALKIFGRDKSVIQKNYNIHLWLNVCSTEFWSRLQATEDFWLNLKPLPWAIDLINTLSQEAPVMIASSPSLDPDCLRQKLLWLEKHIGGKLVRNYFFTTHKHLLGKKGRVLVDDYYMNCLGFEEQGGSSILFPAAWNSIGEVKDPVGYTLKELDKLFHLK